MIRLSEADEFQFAILSVKFPRSRKPKTIIGSILRVEGSWIYFALHQGGVIQIHKKRILWVDLLGNAKEETLYWLPEALFILWYKKKFGRFPYFPSWRQVREFWAEIGPHLAKISEGKIKPLSLPLLP